MKRRFIIVIAAVMAFALATSAFAATAESAQTLWQQVGAKIDELKATTLTTAQTKTLTSIEKSYAKLAKTYATKAKSTAKPSNSAKPEAPKQDTEREAKLTAFKATLTESQKAAYEALMPSMPSGAQGGAGAPSGERPSGSPPPMGTGEKPTGTPPAGMTGAPTGERPAGGGRQMSDEQSQAMETKRTAFIATLSESQKAAYDAIFPAQGTSAPQGAAAGTTAVGTTATIDFATLSSSKLTKLEKELNSLLTKLNKI